MTRLLLLAVMVITSCSQPATESRRTRVPGGPGTNLSECESRGQGWKIDAVGKCVCKFRYELQESDNTCANTPCLETGGTWKDDTCDCDGRDFDETTGCTGLTAKERCEDQDRVWDDDDDSCNCPTGLHSLKGQCYSSAQKARIEICEAGTGADIAGTWNIDAERCDCPAGHQEIDSVCVSAVADTNAELACTNSPTGTWNEGICSCTTPYVVNNGVCRVNQTLVRACTTSLNPGRWLDEERPPRCDCSTNGLFLINNRCWTCDVGQIQPLMSQNCINMENLSASGCNAINGLHWHAAYNRCAHHSLAEMALIPTQVDCESHGYTWAYGSCYPGQPDISTQSVCEDLDLTWSTNLQVCLGNRTEAQYTAQSQTECTGYYDSYLNKCLPRAMPFNRSLCEGVFGYAWLTDLHAASESMVGSDLGVCLPESVTGLSDAQKEAAIRGFFAQYTRMPNLTATQCAASAENRRVLAWDPDLDACLPGKLPRNPAGTLLTPVTRNQCERFNRHWIGTYYGGDRMGKCYSQPLSTITGLNSQAQCEPDFFWSTHYLRCFPDNPENPGDPRSQNRVVRFTGPQCTALGFDFDNNDCTRTPQAEYNLITTKAACLAATDNGNITPFWIDYYQRCFVAEPTDYAVAFGSPETCSNRYSLTWYPNNNLVQTTPSGVCLPDSPATIAQEHGTEARCALSGVNGDLPGTNAQGFQCSDRGFRHFEGRDPTSGDEIANSTFNVCSSPLRWNSRLDRCTAPAPIVIDSAYCSALGFTWHDTSTAGDIGICTRQTLADIRAIATRAACEAGGLVWGTYTQGEAATDAKTRESEAIGCLPQALPDRGATGAGSQQADRNARDKYIRVCNYYAGITSMRTRADKGWLPSFQFCMLEHTPGQMLALAGPAANQAASTSTCEQTGYSWNANMNLCLPPTPSDINSNPVTITDANRPETLAESFCTDINFQFDNTWKTCHRLGIDFYDTNDIDNDNDTLEGIYDQISESNCVLAPRGRIVWSPQFTRTSGGRGACFPDSPIRTLQSCSNPAGPIRSNTHRIVRDNNECALINSLSEGECTQYASRPDSNDARYLNLSWSPVSSSCIVPNSGLNCNTSTQVSNGEACYNINTLNRDQCRSISGNQTVWSPLFGARRNSAGTANMQGCFFRTAVPSVFQGGVWNIATNGQAQGDNFFEVNRNTTRTDDENSVWARHFECKNPDNILGVVRSMRAPWRSTVNGTTGSLLCSLLQDGLEIDTSTLRLAGGSVEHVNRGVAGGRCSDHDSYEDPDCGDVWGKCPEDYVMTGACMTGADVTCATFDTVAGQQNRSNWHYTFVARCHKVKIRGTDRYLEVTNGITQTWGHRNPSSFKPSQGEIDFHNVMVGGCNGGAWEFHCPYPRNGVTDLTSDFNSGLRKLAPHHIRSGSNSLNWAE